MIARPLPIRGALGAGARGPRRLPSAGEAAVVCSGCRIFSDMVVVDAQAHNRLAGHASTPLVRSPEHRRRPPLVERAEARSGRHPTVTLLEQERSPEVPALSSQPAFFVAGIEEPRTERRIAPRETATAPAASSHLSSVSNRLPAHARRRRTADGGRQTADGRRQTADGGCLLTPRGSRSEPQREVEAAIQRTRPKRLAR